MSNKNEIKSACIILIFVIIIIVIISLLYRKNSSNVEYEQFLNYQDAKTKTLNWCSKMKNVGLLTNDQFDQCVSSYTDTTLGILPSQINDSSKKNLELDYSLYNSRLKALTPNLLNTNTNNIMLVNSDGSYMGCGSDNATYFTNDSNTNIKELTFTLTPLKNNHYAISSSYGKYLINNDNTPSINNGDIPIIIAGGGGGGGGASGGVPGGLGGSAGSNPNGDGGSGTGNTGVIGGLGGPFKKTKTENSTSGFSLAGNNSTNTGGGGGGSNGGMMGNSNGAGGGAGGSYVNPDYIANNATATIKTNISSGSPSVFIDWTSQPNSSISKVTKNASLNPTTTKAPTTAVFTGAQQTWTVPSFIYPELIPVSQATFTVIGGKGSGNGGGFGSNVSVTLKVSPGTTYNIFVGTYASGSTGGINQSGYSGGNGIGTAGGGGAATTVFLGVTPEATAKAAKTVFCASFTGKTLGPMATWVINNYDSGNNNYKKLTFESLKKSNYFLSSKVNNVDNTLVLNNGNDVTNMWQAIPLTDNIVGSSTTDKKKGDYTILKNDIINKLINVKAKIICLEAFETTLYSLKTMITSNYQNIVNYIDTSIGIKNNYTLAKDTTSDIIQTNPDGSPVDIQTPRWVDSTGKITDVSSFYEQSINGDKTFPNFKNGEILTFGNMTYIATSDNIYSKNHIIKPNTEYEYGYVVPRMSPIWIDISTAEISDVSSFYQQSIDEGQNFPNFNNGDKITINDNTYTHTSDNTYRTNYILNPNRSKAYIYVIPEIPKQINEQPNTTQPNPDANKIMMSSNDKAIVIANINSVKETYLNQINNDIGSISSLLLSAKQTEADIESEYSSYLQSLNRDLTEQSVEVKSNVNVILKSKTKIDNLNNDSAYYNNKQEEISKIDKTSNLNIDLLTSYTNSNAMLVKGYPVLIFIVLLILIYLIYVTFNTFMQNIYSVY